MAVGAEGLALLLVASCVFGAEQRTDSVEQATGKRNHRSSTPTVKSVATAALPDTDNFSPPPVCSSASQSTFGALKASESRESVSRCAGAVVAFT